jgi:uncharacterized protein with von Willebrand factor type A (vWA) domain
LLAAGGAACPFANESSLVPRRAKDFIEISDYTSLDSLIAYLETIRDNLPQDCEAELKLRGDDVFGRRLTITYMRELTPEEEAMEAKYAAAPQPDAGIERLRAQLDGVPYGADDKTDGSGAGRDS